MKDARVDEIRKLLPQAMLPDWVHLGGRMVRLLRDRLHPQQHDAVLNRLLAQVRASVALREERRLNVPKLNYPPDLPITARKDDIVAAIREHQVVIIAGETGSGKTTQIPKMCLEAGQGDRGENWLHAATARGGGVHLAAHRGRTGGDVGPRGRLHDSF